VRLLRIVLALAILGAPPPLAAATARRAQAEKPDVAALLAGLGLTRDEREESLAFALARFSAGDCEGALHWLELASAATGAGDELAQRIATERQRVQAWIALRDAFLAELVTSQKPLTLELGAKKVASPITREGDELVLARGAQRVSVRSLAPEALLPQIPKERFAGANEWLKIYPYCADANPKWKRLTTKDPSAQVLQRDAEEFYPHLVALRPLVVAIEELAERAPPADPAGARAALSAVEALLAQRTEACVAARLAALGVLAEQLLAEVADGMTIAELVHAKVSEPSPGTLRLAYDFASPDQAEDWQLDEGYLDDLRRQLPPLKGDEEVFAPGPQGFAGAGATCWRHVLDFQAPTRVRYQVRWELDQSAVRKVFAFAVGMLADASERHLRAQELGFLYVDEQDGRYTAVRPKGDSTVQLGRTYTVELVHDGEKVGATVDGELRAEARAETRKEGHVFLWCHSDLRITVPALEIEGRVTPASLAALRAQWVRAKLHALGVADDK
jgi:hypothetical protein